MASHHDHSFAPALARLLAQRLALHVIRYTSRGPAPHPAEPHHRFRVCGASTDDSEDLAAVAAAAAAAGLGPLRALVGHSRGANTALYFAAAQALAAPLVCLAPRFDLPGMLQSRLFSDAQREALASGQPVVWATRAGDITVTPEDAAQLQALRDMRAPLAALPPRAPLLLCHGTADATIPHADSQAMAALRPRATQLLLLPGAPHNFSKGHEAAMAEAVAGFLAAQLEQLAAPGS
jgi:pimeloyl-ACP methyl ester carboxylesterase